MKIEPGNARFVAVIVALMKKEDGLTIIGCEECDMRINQESN